MRPPRRKARVVLTVNCVLCHNHKCDPIAQKDYYAREASIFGYVETEYRLAPRAAAEAYLDKTEEINTRLDNIRSEIDKLEKPYRAKRNSEQVKQKFPDNIYQAAAKPENERTPGEELLAVQVLTGVKVSVVEVEKLMSPAELARKKALTAERTALLKQKPKP